MSETILIVDDELQVRQMVRRLAETLGLDILEAESGEQALEKVQQYAVDLVITDLKMPGMNGLKLAQTLLSQDPDRPVLLMTAYADLDSARKAVQIGIYEYFTKPFEVNDLFAGIRRALEHRRMAMEIQAYQRNIEQKVNTQEDLIPEDLMSLVDQTLTPLSVAIGRMDTMLMNQNLFPRDRRALEIAKKQMAFVVELLGALQENLMMTECEP